jgi:dihydroorotase
MYDLILQGGRVIDSANTLDGIYDVAVKDGSIAAVAPGIDPNLAARVIPLPGRILAPGLIDAHCHVVAPLWDNAVGLDEAGVDSGVCLVCDAGTLGAANFAAARDLVLPGARTDLVVFLNFATTGLLRIPEIQSEADFDLDLLRSCVEQNRPLVRGIKFRAMEAVSVLGLPVALAAKKLASELGLPLMVHIGEFRERRPDDPMDDYGRAVVDLLDRGDSLSHFMTWRPGGMFPSDDRVYPELEKARKRGVILDSCHGGNNFSFKVARQALQLGLLPDLISTDLCASAVPAVQSLCVTMSKFLNLGLSLAQVIAMTTVNPAAALGLEERQSGLAAGSPADISVLELVRGEYLFFDGKAGHKMRGEFLLEPRLTIKRGRELPCRSRYHLPSELVRTAREFPAQA